MTSLSHAYGRAPAVLSQPRSHRVEPRPAPPWESRRLPAALHAGDRRRMLFRTLLRHADGVAVDFADGTTGVVAHVVLPALGFDFWPEALLVAAPDGRRRVPVDRVRRLDVRAARIEVA